PIERYPDTDKSLSGVQLPDWDKVKALCEQAAAVYHGGKLQGWDIMLTDQGPVIIELEPDGGGSTLSQAAQRKGLLDDKMKQHLAWAKAVRDAKYEG
ncbi:MAG: sugar-transfer associated ATP-grasp domain-containing protein, partial [Rickettsiales bacterium]